MHYIRQIFAPTGLKDAGLKILNGAVTMVAVEYTAKGIKNGINFAMKKVYGENTNNDSDDSEESNKALVPNFVKDEE